MEKIYFDQEFKDSWVVKDLSDFYTFRCVNSQTNTEMNHILSWTKDIEREEQIESDIQSKDGVRLYLTEIEGQKIFFTLRYDDNFCKFILSPATAEDIYEMDKLFTKTGYKFIGTQNT